MKKKTWKRCVCMIGVVLFAVTGLNANNRVPDSKHSKKCTFYILRFGCSFAAVNTIKPQLL